MADHSHEIDLNNVGSMLAYLDSEERNVRLASFFDSGWNVRLGDSINGFDDEHWEGKDLVEGCRWLVRRHMELKARRALMTPEQRLKAEFSRAQKDELL